MGSSSSLIVAAGIVWVVVVVLFVINQIRKNGPTDGPSGRDGSGWG
jgi:hypothetical protein